MRVLTFLLFYAFVTTLLTSIVLGHYDEAYNCEHSEAQANYPNWMRELNDSTPLSMISMPGSHDTMADCPALSSCSLSLSLALYFSTRTQVMPLANQLKSGIRVLDIGLRWYESYHDFQIHHGIIPMAHYFVPDVLEVVKEFLTENPTEVVIMRVKRDQDPDGSGETEALSNTLLSYSNYIVPSTCVSNTTQVGSLVLGPKTGGDSCKLRGKMLIFLDGFAAIAANGFTEANWPPSGASVQDNYDIPDFPNVYDKWISIKKQWYGTTDANKIYINFLSATSTQRPIYPFFVASGHRDPVDRPPANDDSRRKAATITIFDYPQDLYPDFPRTDWFLDVRTIYYEGMNTLTTERWELDIEYNQRYCAQPCRWTRVGIVLSDFAGRTLIESILNSNGRIRGNQLITNATNATLNRPPVAAFTSTPFVSQEGTVITFDASPSSDPDGDALTFQWDLLGAVGCVPHGSTNTAVAKFLCSQNQNSVVKVTVSDTFGDHSAVGTNFIVHNVPPTVSIQPNVGTYEGGTVFVTITITDPGTLDTFSGTIDWGDGSSAEPFFRNASSTGTQRFTRSHLYLDDDPTGTPSDNYTVSVVVFDDDGGSGSNSTVIRVVNVNPTVSLQSNKEKIEEGETLSVAITVTDPGTLDTFSGTMNWGDGSSPEPFVRDASSTGTQTFTLSHLYVDDNPSGTPSDNYTVSVVVFNDDGGSASDSTVITVVNANPIATIVSLKDELGQVLGSTFPFLLPRIALTTAYQVSDVGVGDTQVLLSDWGDGSSDVVDVPNPLPSHAYNRSGTFTLKVTATDDDTGVGFATQRVPVVSQSDALAKVIKLIKKKLKAKNEEDPVMHLSNAIDDLAGKSPDKTKTAIKSVQKALVALRRVRALSSFGSIVKIQLLTAKSLALDAIAKSTKSPEVVQKANAQILNGDRIRDSDPVRTTGFYLKAAKLLTKG